MHQGQRDYLDSGGMPETPGQLAYAIYSILQGYLAYRAESFVAHAEILGTLEAVKLEWARRQVAPYEDEKLKENGDV